MSNERRKRLNIPSKTYVAKKDLRKHVGGQIPASLHRNVKRWADDHGITTTDCIRVALENLVSPATRKDELFEALDRIERNQNALLETSDVLDLIRGDIALTSELVATLAKNLFFYSIEPSVLETARSRMDARFKGFLRVVAKRTIRREISREISDSIEKNGEFL